MSANQEKKKLIVEEIKEKIQNAKSIIFIDYRGLNVNNDIKLRREFKKNNCDYKVYKNTMMKLAFKGTPCEELDKHLESTNALAVSRIFFVSIGFVS